VRCGRAPGCDYKQSLPNVLGAGVGGQHLLVRGRRIPASLAESRARQDDQRHSGPDQRSQLISPEPVQVGADHSRIRLLRLQARQ
jgi:hypothetical protein